MSRGYVDPYLRGCFDRRSRMALSAALDKHPDEDGVLTDAEWLAVLVEEVGEAARALNDREGDERLVEELAQVAAMSCRWACSVLERRS